MSSSTNALVGVVLSDRYRIDRLLGEGGMGKVYAAEHVLMRKRLAIKVLHRELCTLPDVVARFEREAMASANIEHPNVAAATDFGRLPDGSLFLVMELLEGTSLRDEIAKGPLEPRRALHIARQIAAALGAAHGLGIVHRDLKPENVMLVTRGDDETFVKVLDFGIAKIPIGQAHAEGAGPFVSGPLTRAGEVFGTPEYMAPEQALGQSVDGRADLYALGAITYEMLSGFRPFSSQSETGILAQQLAKPVPTFAERAPAVRIPPRVEQVVMKLLVKEVAGRYQRAEEAVQALDELLQPTPGTKARLFTLTDGSPTAFLGTAADVHGGALPAPARVIPPVPELGPLPPAIAPAPAPAPVPAPAPAPAPELAPGVAGPGGTLPLVDPPLVPELVGAPTEHPAAPAPRAARLGPALSRIVALTRTTLVIVCDFIDANRHRLPPRLRHALRSVPAAALLTFALVIVWGGLLVFTVWAGTSRRDAPLDKSAQRSETPSVEKPKPIDPALAEIPAAKQKGHAALEELVTRYPKSAAALVELGVSHAARAEPGDAVAAVGKALELDAKVSEQPPVAEIVAAGVRKRDTSETSFALLSEKMGAAGARVLYDLAIDQKVQASLRMRAERWVRSPEFEKAASPEVQVAGALRYAKSCSARHALMTRVGEVGGKRALGYLKIARVRNGCGRRGRDDCFACLRKDDALSKAIAAVEKRLADKPDTP